MNWLEGISPQMTDPMTERTGSPIRDQTGRPMVMPVFAGHELVVVGGAAAWAARSPPMSLPAAVLS